MSTLVVFRLALQGRLVQRVLQDPPDHKGYKVLQDPPGHKGYKALQDPPGRKGYKALQDPLGRKDLLVRKAHKALRVQTLRLWSPSRAFLFSETSITTLGQTAG